MLRSASLVVLTLLPGILRAQLPAMPAATAAPESVTVAFLGHVRAHNWTGAVAYFDPADVGRFGEVFRRLTALPGAAAGMAEALGLEESAVAQLSGADLVAHFLVLAAKTNPDAFEGMKGATHSILGRVAEDSNQVHLVVRAHLSVKSIPFSAVEVRSLRRTGEGWRLQLPPEMEGVILGIEAALSDAE